MTFRIGQKVTPRDKHWQVVFGEMAPQDMLEFGKVYTVAGYPLASKVLGYFAGMVQLEERPQDKLYHEDKLEALVDDFVLEAELISEPEDLKKPQLIDG